MTGVDYMLRVIFRMWRSPREFRPHQGRKQPIGSPKNVEL